MPGRAAIVLALALLLGGPLLAPGGAHCPTSVPTVEMAYPSEGMAVQSSCYADYGACFVDTFHVDTLRSQLARLWAESKHVSFLYVDSVRNYLTLDTVYYRGEPYYIDTFQTETVHISVHTDLKEAVPVRRMAFTDRWMAVPNNPLATTYIPLTDTPFVAFFNAYDSIRQLGIGPMDGCFFEPTAFVVSGGKIRKKGLVGDRIPGIALPLDDFFKTVGREPVEAPPVGIRPPARRRQAALGPRGKDPLGPVYDAQGRRREDGRRATWYPGWTHPAAADPRAGRPGQE